MAEEQSKHGWVKQAIIYPALAMLFLGTTAPWWWEKLFPRDEVTEITPGSGGTDQPSGVDTVGSDPDKPDPVTPESTRVEEEANWNINEIGVWGNTKKGDNDINTQPGRRTKIKCVGFLTHTDYKVNLKLIYRVEEVSPNHTMFEGTVTREILSSPPPGKKIIQLKVKGNLPVVTMEQILIGRQHGAVRFDNVQNTYFDRLSAIVDGPGDDQNTIGLKGKVSYVVVYDNY